MSWDDVQSAADRVAGSIAVCAIGTSLDCTRWSFPGAQSVDIADIVDGGAGSSTHRDGVTDKQGSEIATATAADTDTSNPPNTVGASATPAAVVVVLGSAVFQRDHERDGSDEQPHPADGSRGSKRATDDSHCSDDESGTIAAALETLTAIAALETFVIAVVPAGSVREEDVDAVAARVDGLLLAGGASDKAADTEAVAATAELLSIVGRPGFVNLDLTDAETVFAAGVAAIATGIAPRSSPEQAVSAAFSALPEPVDSSDAQAALVDVAVDPATSIAAATDAVAAVRDQIDPAANVIWGGAVDDEATDEIRVQIVIAGVRYAPPLRGGDPCPRCGSPLSVFALGTNETLSCDACGYSGIGVRRE